MEDVSKEIVGVFSQIESVGEIGEGEVKSVELKMLSKRQSEEVNLGHSAILGLSLEEWERFEQQVEETVDKESMDSEISETIGEILVNNDGEIVDYNIDSEYKE